MTNYNPDRLPYPDKPHNFCFSLDGIALMIICWWGI